MCAMLRHNDCFDVLAIAMTAFSESPPLDSKQIRPVK